MVISPSILGAYHNPWTGNSYEPTSTMGRDRGIFHDSLVWSEATYNNCVCYFLGDRHSRWQHQMWTVDASGPLGLFVIRWKGHVMLPLLLPCGCLASNSNDLADLPWLLSVENSWNIVNTFTNFWERQRFGQDIGCPVSSLGTHQKLIFRGYRREARYPLN